MARWLMLSLLFLSVAVPACAAGGNHAPKVSLEVYGFEEEPDPLPAGICVHEFPPFPSELPCYAVRLPYSFYYIPVHVCALDHPICPTTGVPCIGLGGYVGLAFGLSQTAPTGSPLMFMSWNACYGFLKGPSAAGEPAACLASSTALCHDWYDHEGYLVYLNTSAGTDKVYFDIVNSADLNNHYVINCLSTYDENTTIGGRAQVGGAQDILCPGPTAVEESTWGRIKTIYR